MVPDEDYVTDLQTRLPRTGFPLHFPFLYIFLHELLSFLLGPYSLFLESLYVVPEISHRWCWLYPEMDVHWEARGPAHHCLEWRDPGG